MHSKKTKNFKGLKGVNNGGLVTGDLPSRWAVCTSWIFAWVADMPIIEPRPSLVQWKVGVGGRAINHQFKRAQAPLGDAQGNITQLLKQNFYLLFFTSLAGQQHSYTGRGTCTSSPSSISHENMSPHHSSDTREIIFYQILHIWLNPDKSHFNKFIQNILINLKQALLYCAVVLSEAGKLSWFLSFNAQQFN